MMKHPLSFYSLILTLAVLMMACATSYRDVPVFAPVAVDFDGRALKTQNILLILDASSSMQEGYQQWMKFDIAIAVVRNLAQVLPENRSIQSGLRIFGGDPVIFRKSTELIDDVGAFYRFELEQALATVAGTGGPSPLTAATGAVIDDLEGVEGKTAILVVTDGKSMGMGPAAKAAAIKETLGDSVCIYPIQVGDDPNGSELLDAMARIGACGFAFPADQLLHGPRMADYVARVFLGDEMDSDGDGVVDAKDSCSSTPVGVKVDASGCPLDSDMDGVPDYQDKCPGTPAGVTVDVSGCPVTILDTAATSWTFHDINFEIAKADIRPASYGILDEIAAALSASPRLKVVVEGHTDNRGSRAFNMDLSQRRAQAVVDYLVAKGIAPDRLTARGYGPDRPVADNKTRQGRTRNRRVQFVKTD